MPERRMAYVSAMISGLQGQPSAPEIHALVVDRDASERSALMALVRSFGVAVRGAEDTAQAYDLVLEHRPDLVLCDLQSVDGFGFVRRLRRDPRLQRILIVAVGGPGRVLDIATTRVPGFDGHVAKPVMAQALARLLDSTLDLQQEQDQGA